MVHLAAIHPFLNICDKYEHNSDTCNAMATEITFYEELCPVEFVVLGDS